MQSWCVGHGTLVESQGFKKLGITGGKVKVEGVTPLIIDLPDIPVPKDMQDNMLCLACVRRNEAALGSKEKKPVPASEYRSDSDSESGDEVEELQGSVSEGFMIGGKYRVGKKLGSGSYGTVHMLTEGSKTYAVKIIPKSSVEKPQALTQLRREIDLLKTLNHPNIIKFIDELVDQTNIYVVMEYASKGDAFDLLISHAKGVPEDIASRIFYQVFSAVDYMHKNGIVHRDIKPENFFLDSNGDIKLGDFGFANYMFKQGRQSILQTPCGSAQYVAPEIINKLPQSEAVDVWSLGIALYTMVTGQDPWNKKGKLLSLVQQYHQILKGEYNKIPDTVSSEAKDLMEKMIVVDHKKRITLKDAMQHPWFKKYRK